MTPELIYKLQTLGRLLAQSPLDEKIKEVILTHLAQLTEAQIDGIISSLERETLELSELLRHIATFDSEQETRWNDLEVRQRKIAEEETQKVLQKLGIEE
jgi:hypothetical protein